MVGKYTGNIGERLQKAGKNYFENTTNNMLNEAFPMFKDAWYERRSIKKEEEEKEEEYISDRTKSENDLKGSQRYIRNATTYISPKSNNNEDTISSKIQEDAVVELQSIHEIMTKNNEILINVGEELKLFVRLMENKDFGGNGLGSGNGGGSSLLGGLVEGAAGATVGSTLLESGAAIAAGATAIITSPATLAMLATAAVTAVVAGLGYYSYEKLFSGKAEKNKDNKNPDDYIINDDGLITHKSSYVPSLLSNSPGHLDEKYAGPFGNINIPNLNDNGSGGIKNTKSIKESLKRHGNNKDLLPNNQASLPELNSEDKKTFDDLQNAPISANDPRISKYNRLSKEQLASAGVEKYKDEKSGQEFYKSIPINVKEEPKKLTGDALGKILLHGEGNYTSISGGGHIDLSRMTVGEVEEYQKTNPEALGKFQMIPSTFKSAVKEAGISQDTKLTPEVQEKLFARSLIKSNARAYILGKGDNEESTKSDLYTQWASIGVDKPMWNSAHTQMLQKGESFYTGIGNNKASISIDSAFAALTQDREKIAKERKEHPELGDKELLDSIIYSGATSDLVKEQRQESLASSFDQLNKSKLPSKKEADSIAIGDSIAVGYNNINKKGTSKGSGGNQETDVNGLQYAKVGLGSSAILHNVKTILAKDPNAFKGKDIIFSTGLENDAKGLKDAEEGYKLIRDNGANQILVSGISNNPKFEENRKQLEMFKNDTKATMEGNFKPVDALNMHSDSSYYLKESSHLKKMAEDAAKLASPSSSLPKSPYGDLSYKQAPSFSLPKSPNMPDMSKLSEPIIEDFISSGRYKNSYSPDPLLSNVLTQASHDDIARLHAIGSSPTLSQHPIQSPSHTIQSSLKKDEKEKIKPVAPPDEMIRHLFMTKTGRASGPV